jgi:DNA-binding IclR family transcriptional regulator
VAAPVFNSKGKLEGCIGLSAPIFSFSLDDVDRYGQMVRKAADKASQELGYKFK